MVVHSKDEQEVGLGTWSKITWKTASTFPDNNGAVVVRPKQVFRLTQNAFKNIAIEF